jgi:6-phospho-3-hexuloisomerase
MGKTYEAIRSILDELDSILKQLDEQQVDALVEAILKARRILTFALGREGLAIRGFTMRLMHLGFDVHAVFDVTAPPIGPGDIFLCALGPGYLATTEGLINIAHKAGAKVVMVTAEPQGQTARKADQLVVIPAQTMAKTEGSASKQAMGSAFEQALWLLFDALVPRLMAETGQTLADLRARHANLE